MTNEVPTESNRVRRLFRERFTFQISLDTPHAPQGLAVAEAALKAGVTILELGTPLLKYEGVRNVVPIFRQRFPTALLLADMKTMDGGEGEANAVYSGGANVIDFLALAGEATAKAVCAVRDAFREADPPIPRLAFADVLVPMQGPAGPAVETAKRMLAAGVDGVGVHLQYDARRVDPGLVSRRLPERRGVRGFRERGRERIRTGGGRPQRRAGRRPGPQRAARLRHQRQSRACRTPSRAMVCPGDEIERHIRDFIDQVSAAG